MYTHMYILSHGWINMIQHLTITLWQSLTAAFHRHLRPASRRTARSGGLRPWWVTRKALGFWSWEISRRFTSFLKLLIWEYLKHLGNCWWILWILMSNGHSIYIYICVYMHIYIYHIILYHITLYYIISYYIILYYMIFYCIILYCIILYHITLYLIIVSYYIINVHIYIMYIYICIYYARGCW